MLFYLLFLNIEYLLLLDLTLDRCSLRGPPQLILLQQEIIQLNWPTDKRSLVMLFCLRHWSIILRPSNLVRQILWGLFYFYRGHTGWDQRHQISFNLADFGILRIGAAENRGDHRQSGLHQVVPWATVTTSALFGSHTVGITHCLVC